MEDFQKYCAQIGITDVTIHSFRHYFCRTLLKNGVDISIVAQLAGHASGYVTAQVYTIPRQEELRQQQKINLGFKKAGIICLFFNSILPSYFLLSYRLLLLQEVLLLVSIPAIKQSFSTCFIISKKRNNRNLHA